MRLTQKLIVKLVIFTVLFCTYILPTGIMTEGDYTLPKIIFVLIIGILYLLSIINTKKISKRELLFDIIIIGITIYTKNINYIMFITICFLDKFMKYKDDINEYFNKSKILYICLIFTLIYSVIFSFSDDSRGRYAFAAIKEINQSGLSIFCLGILLLQKNKKVGIFTLIFGCLTFSRSYYLAILSFLIFTFFRKRKIINKITRFLNYWNITVISSVVLILLGVFYINAYRAGKIYLGDYVSNRLYTFLDYSNFFRFQSVIILLQCFQKYPLKILFGMTDVEFIDFGYEISREMNLPYRGTPPHNLFFSHLKIYGVFAIVEIIYVSKILKRIINNENFGIYLAIALYSIFLGAGLYSYWLYLSVFVLIYFKNAKIDEGVINGKN